MNYFLGKNYRLCLMYKLPVLEQLPIQIAHRGNSLLCGDNNMKSFVSAVENGFDMIELDILLCKTGESVVFHDPYVNGVFINNMTLEEVKEQKIHTLEEFFDVINVDDIDIFLDLKGSENVIHPLMTMIKNRFTFEQMEKIYVSSFNRKFVQPLAESLLPVNIGLTTENRFTIEELTFLCKYIKFACFHWTILDEEAIKMLHEHQIKVFTYTCKEDIIQRYMMRYDIDGIVTNYPLFAQEPLKD